MYIQVLIEYDDFNSINNALSAIMFCIEIIEPISIYLIKIKNLFYFTCSWSYSELNMHTSKIHKYTPNNCNIMIIKCHTSRMRLE